jgi:hypothetical protein
MPTKDAKVTARSVKTCYSSGWVGRSFEPEMAVIEMRGRRENKILASRTPKGRGRRAR